MNCEHQGKGAVHSVAMNQGLFHRESNNCADPWSLRGVRLTNGEMTIPGGGKLTLVNKINLWNSHTASFFQRVLVILSQSD